MGMMGSVLPTHEKCFWPVQSKNSTAGEINLSQTLLVPSHRGRLHLHRLLLRFLPHNIKEKYRQKINFRIKKSDYFSIIL
jgi:predicted phosphoadenosine phosphosulfate sulfurtransferase